MYDVKKCSTGRLLAQLVEFWGLDMVFISFSTVGEGSSLPHHIHAGCQ